jgi:hypothetical protein
VNFDPGGRKHTPDFDAVERIAKILGVTAPYRYSTVRYWPVRDGLAMVRPRIPVIAPLSDDLGKIG